MSDNEKQEFAAVLLQLGKGREHDKASELLTEAVAAVKELGKPAEMTIKLRIDPMKNNSRVVQITAKAAASIPKPPNPPTIFFADDEGGLHRNDPDQREMWTSEQVADGKTAAAGRD